MSGPQLAVPRPRWAASRWTIVSGAGTSSTSWVAAARSAARKCVAETWRGRSSVDPQPAPASVASARASGRRRGRRSPAAGCTGRAARLTVDAPATDEPAALAVRIGLVRAGPEPLELLEPGHDLEHGADPRAGRRGRPGCSTASSTRIAAAGRPADRCSWPMTRPMPARRVSLRTIVVARRLRSIADEPPLEPVEPQAAQRPADAADPVVVGRGAPQRQASGGRPAAVDEQPVVVDVDRRRGAGDRLPAVAAARRLVADGELRRPQTSKPAGAQGVVAAVDEADRQPGLAAGLERRTGQPSSTTVAALAGRRASAASQLAARRDLAVDGELPARPQPAEVAEVLAVRDLDAPGRAIVGGRRSGPAPRAPCAPTSPASGGGPARPGRRCRSCRRWACRRSRRRRPSASCRRAASGRGRGPSTPR